MLRIVALPALVLAFAPFHSSVKPLSPPVQAMIKKEGFWHQGCPVGMAGLRVLTVTYRGFDGRAHTGRLIVNRAAAGPLRRVFHRLYQLGFPIRYMALADMYGPKAARPADGDVTGAFDCRQAVPSPCSGGTGTGSWSMHAFGLAVDIDPMENPYVGCGKSRDPRARPYFDRSRHRPGMVTRKVVAAFASVGWGWGGAWSGNTKDYMHFSSTGH